MPTSLTLSLKTRGLRHRRRSRSSGSNSCFKVSFNRTHTHTVVERVFQHANARASPTVSCDVVVARRVRPPYVDFHGRRTSLDAGRGRGDIPLEKITVLPYS